MEILKRQAKRQQAQMDAILATVCSEAQCDAIAIETVEAEEEDEDEREDQEQDYDYDYDDDDDFFNFVYNILSTAKSQLLGSAVNEVV